MSYINAYTLQPMERTGLFTGDNVSFEMLPDNTLIYCQFIDMKGEKIKLDKSKGDEFNRARVMDQRIFYSQILYAVEGINGETYYTRTDHIKYYTYEQLSQMIKSWCWGPWAQALALRKE